MAYEIFTKKVTRAGSPTLAVSKSGRIAFNKAATATFDKNAVEFVLLLWDKENRKIGVRPITKKDPRSYTLKYGPKKSSVYFACKTFFDHVGIDYTQTKAFPAIWTEDEGMLEAEIPEGSLKDQKQQRLIEMEGRKRDSKTG